MNTNKNSIIDCIPNDKNTRFALPNIVTIENAEQIAAEIKQIHITDNMSLIIDASRLERITSPGIQLLVSLGKTLQSQNATLEIQNLPHPLKVVFGELGLQTIITQG